MLTTGKMLSNTSNEPFETSQTSSKKTSMAKSVVALGRIEPQGELLHISAPTSFQGSRTRVEQLFVKKGDKVKRGQLIAVLDNYEPLNATLKESQQQVKVAQAKLAQVKAGVSSDKIEAQKRVINRLQVELKEEKKAFEAKLTRLNAELDNLKVDHHRYQILAKEGVIAASERDRRQLAVDTAQAQLDEAIANQNRTIGVLQEQIEEANATLNSLKKVRDVDIQFAQAEVNRTLSAVKQAQTNLNFALVYAPQAGQILDIYTKLGEIVDEQGIVELGQTHQMTVIAEVYETDITRIKIGDNATITSPSLTEELEGTVSYINLKIGKKEILDTDPIAEEDARIIEVKVTLNSQDSVLVSGLTNLRVKVVIVSV